MLGAVKRKWNIILCKILNLHNFGCGMVVIPADRNNHSVTDLDVVLVGNVIIAFVAFVKFHAAINIVVSATPDLPVDRWIEYFTASVELNKIPYTVASSMQPFFWVMGICQRSPLDCEPLLSPAVIIVHPPR